MSVPGQLWQNWPETPSPLAAPPVAGAAKRVHSSRLRLALREAERVNNSGRRGEERGQGEGVWTAGGGREGQVLQPRDSGKWREGRRERRRDGRMEGRTELNRPGSMPTAAEGIPARLSGTAGLGHCLLQGVVPPQTPVGAPPRPVGSAGQELRAAAAEPGR